MPHVRVQVEIPPSYSVAFTNMTQKQATDRNLTRKIR